MAFAITFSSGSFPWIFLTGLAGIAVIIDKLTGTEIEWDINSTGSDEPGGIK